MDYLVAADSANTTSVDSCFLWNTTITGEPLTDEMVDALHDRM